MIVLHDCQYDRHRTRCTVASDSLGIKTAVINCVLCLTLMDPGFYHNF